MTEPSSSQAPQPYLFLLAQPSPAVRREAVNRLRETGLRVVAQYGRVAIEALATPDEAQSARDLGLFAATLSGSMKEQHLERLSEEQRQVVRQWNTRFTTSYRDLTKDKSRLGKSWGDPDVDPPAPHSAIDPEDFLAFIDEYERSTGKGPWQQASEESDELEQEQQAPEPPSGRMTPEEFTEYERELAKQLGDPTAAYHLSRLAWSLGTSYYSRIRNIDRDLLAKLLDHFFHQEAACWEMSGEIAVGIVFVESDREGGPRFGDSERDQVCQEIIDGLNWLAAEQPAGNLSWVYDFQFLRIDVANGDEGVCTPGGPLAALEPSWRDPALAQVVYNGTTYPGEWDSVARYREDMRDANWSAHAIVIFVTPYANCWHAYASGGRLTLARHNDWGNWGRSSLDRITAHEVSHLFGAADEYTGNGTPCSTCASVHGCDQIPNGNCGACARPQQDCMMGGNDRRICAYTRGQIGWSTLFVELTTADVQWAGTDDDVWLDIGDRSFVLDNPNHDDRERNNREGHALWAPDVRREDIKRIMIRKSEDGFAGGWRLRGVKVWHEGTIICDQPSINQWLEDDTRIWTGCVFDRDLVNTLEVRISTADAGWAGTDDDVTITLAGRSWNLDNDWHDDFERNNTDTFHVDPGSGLRVSDIHSVRVHKSSDGFAGGWKLKGVQIVANGGTIYNNQGINRWLEDDDRTWTDSF